MRTRRPLLQHHPQFFSFFSWAALAINNKIIAPVGHISKPGYSTPEECQSREGRRWQKKNHRELSEHVSIRFFDHSRGGATELWKLVRGGGGVLS